MAVALPLIRLPAPSPRKNGEKRHPGIPHQSPTKKGDPKAAPLMFRYSPSPGLKLFPAFGGSATAETDGTGDLCHHAAGR
jgi:hypothetical protein